MVVAQCVSEYIFGMTEITMTTGEKESRILIDIDVIGDWIMDKIRSNQSMPLGNNTS